eukprot:4204030-Pleurochrysis_carterae.AAC.2
MPSLAASSERSGCNAHRHREDQMSKPGALKRKLNDRCKKAEQTEQKPLLHEKLSARRSQMCLGRN